MNQNLSLAAMNWNKTEYFTAIDTVETHSDEEVDHEEDIECEVNLLCCILSPGDTSLHGVTEGGC